MPSRLGKRGVCAIIPTREAGMRWTRERVRRTCLSRTAKPCRPDTPTLVSSVQNDLLAMGANKPGSQGERGGYR
jgi:hypothetical protein